MRKAGSFWPPLVRFLGIFFPYSFNSVEEKVSRLLLARFLELPLWSG